MNYLKKVTLIISTDQSDIENYPLSNILSQDIIDYEIEELTAEERECFD